MGFDVSRGQGVIDIVTQDGKTVVIKMPNGNNGQLDVSCTMEDGSPCMNKVQYDGKDVNTQQSDSQNGQES